MSHLLHDTGEGQSSVHHRGHRGGPMNTCVAPLKVQ